MASLPYKLLGIGIILIAIAGSAYYSGWHSEHLRFVSFRAKIEAAAKMQASNTAKQDNENAEQTRIVVANLVSDRDKLAAAIKRMRQHSNGSGGMPKTSISQQGNDAASSQFSGACQGSQFYGNALNDALMLQTWQEWAKRQHIPVQ